MRSASPGNFAPLATPGASTTAPAETPVRGLFIDAVARISFLSCCVPLLAFAGLSVGGQLEELKKMSWKVILIFMIVSTCCFFGASLVAQLGFSIQGII